MMEHNDAQRKHTRDAPRKFLQILWDTVGILRPSVFTIPNNYNSQKDQQDLVMTLGIALCRDYMPDHSYLSRLRKAGMLS